MTIHELLNKRFATKQFDPTKKVSAEDLKYVLEAAHLSPSSTNTQPWKIIVVTNPELRVKLREAAYGQPQITDASHLLVIATVKDPMHRVNKVAELIAAGAGKESADRYLAMASGWSNKTFEENRPWLSHQTYIALQSMILAAAERGLDSCPMEGFSKESFDEILGLTDCVATSVLTLGYAAQPGFAKIRVPFEDIVEERA